MPYIQFDQTKPTGTANGSVTLQHVRENLAAIRDIAALGAAIGWNYTWFGGTAENPENTRLDRGTERLRATITWGTSGGADGNATQIVFAYSQNSGGTYETIGTQAIAYDASGNVTSTTWS